MPNEIENIKAQSITLSTLLNGDFRFEVPDYQREYAWGKEQWDALWQDIQSIESNGQHFLGSMVLVDRNTPIGERKVYEIVDGQQRLTTVLILLTALREKFRTEGEDSRAKAINQKYIWDYDSENNKQQNLKLNNLDNDDFRKIIERKEPNKDSQLWKAAKFWSRCKAV